MIYMYPSNLQFHKYVCIRCVLNLSSWVLSPPGSGDLPNPQIGAPPPGEGEAGATWVCCMPTEHIWDSCLLREATCREGVWDPGGLGWYLKGIEVSPNTPLWPTYFIQVRWHRCQATSMSDPFELIGWSCQALFHISSFTSLLLFSLSLGGTFLKETHTSFFVLLCRSVFWPRLHLVKKIRVFTHMA